MQTIEVDWRTDGRSHHAHHNMASVSEDDFEGEDASEDDSHLEGLMGRLSRRDAVDMIVEITDCPKWAARKLWQAWMQTGKNVGDELIALAKLHDVSD